jgi:hypothetical protein
VGPTAGPPPGGPGGPPLNSLWIRPLVPRACNQLQYVVDLIRLIGERSMRQAFQAFLALFGAWPQLAIALDGAPHPFYIAMLVLELALPPLMVVVARRVAAPAIA